MLPYPVPPVLGFVPGFDTTRAAGLCETDSCRQTDWGAIKLTPKCQGELKILAVRLRPNAELTLGRLFPSFLAPAPGHLLPAAEPAALSRCPGGFGVVADAPLHGPPKWRWQPSSLAAEWFASGRTLVDTSPALSTLLSRPLQVDQQETDNTGVPLLHNSKRVGALGRTREGELPCRTSRMLTI